MSNPYYQQGPPPPGYNTYNQPPPPGFNPGGPPPYGQPMPPPPPGQPIYNQQPQYYNPQPQPNPQQPQVVYVHETQRQNDGISKSECCLFGLCTFCLAACCCSD